MFEIFKAKGIIQDLINSLKSTFLDPSMYFAYGLIVAVFIVCFIARKKDGEKKQ